MILLSKITFISDENQTVAIYVNKSKYGDINSLGYDPSYVSTWLDLIKDVRNFENISFFTLSNKGLEKYKRRGERFPKLLENIDKSELVKEE